MVVLLIQYCVLMGQQEKDLKDILNQEHMSILNTIPDNLSALWEIRLHTCVYPEGLDLPMIDISLFNYEGEEEAVHVFGVSVYLFEIAYAKKVKTYFNDLNINGTYTILKTKNYSVVITHGSSVPYDEFVKKNTIFLQKYNILLPELKEFFKEKKRKL